MDHAFSKAERERYDRHFKLPVLGLEGQVRLRAARVLCVGLGGLGAPASLYLAAAGIGTLGLLDDDLIELTNLQRQVLYSTADIHKAKAEIAQNKLLALNPNIQIIAYSERLLSGNIENIFSEYDIVIDGSDNFSTHYLINAACHRLQKPMVFATLTQTMGRCSVFNAPQGPCYHCLFPNPPAHSMGNCSEIGVLGVLPGLLGVIQATEVIKLAAQIGEPLIGRVLCVDMLRLCFEEYRLEKNNDCPLCSGLGYSFNTDLIEETNAMNSITVEELQQLRMEQPGDICILDVRRPDEYAICNINGQLIPFEDLPDRLSEIDKNKHIIVHCKSGGRSAKATQILLEKKFPRVSNLRGGIMAWADKIDPDLMRY